MKQQLRLIGAAAVAVVVLAASALSAFGAAPALHRAQWPAPAIRAMDDLAPKCTKLTAGDVKWVTLTADGTIDQEVDAYPADATAVVPAFDYTCMPAKTTLVTVFTLNGETVFTDKEQPKADPKKGTYLYPLSKKDDSPMDPGEWGVQFFNGKTALASGTVQLGGDAPEVTGVTVQGTITDKKTKKPVKGAYAFVLNQGVTVKAWAKANFPDSDVFTSAVSDSKGKFVLESQLERKVTYSVAFMAKGYKPVSADDFVITDKDPDPLDLTVTLAK